MINNLLGAILVLRHRPNAFVPLGPSTALVLLSSVPLALQRPSPVQDSCICDHVLPYSSIFSRSQHALLVPFRGPLTSLPLPSLKPLNLLTDNLSYLD
jgi:hypothetical protein